MTEWNTEFHTSFLVPQTSCTRTYYMKHNYSAKPQFTLGKHLWKTNAAQNHLFTF